MSKRIDPFVALVMKYCGYTALGDHVDATNLLNNCIGVGAKHLALAYIDYLLSGGRAAPAPLSPVPPSLVNRIEYMCVIPPEKWFLETLSFESPVQLLTREIEYVEKNGESEKYVVMYPATIGIVLGYRDYEGAMNYRGLVINYTGSYYYSYIVSDATLEKMLKICHERGAETFSDAERAFLKQDVLKLVEKGFAKKMEREESGEK